MVGLHVKKGRRAIETKMECNKSPIRLCPIDFRVDDLIRPLSTRLEILSQADFLARSDFWELICSSSYCYSNSYSNANRLRNSLPRCARLSSAQSKRHFTVIHANLFCSYRTTHGLDGKTIAVITISTAHWSSTYRRLLRVFEGHTATTKRRVNFIKKKCLRVEEEKTAEKNKRRDENGLNAWEGERVVVCCTHWFSAAY